MDNTNDKIYLTIAIPFYNAEKYLAQAIDSVINQSFQEWNLLLIDDGSNDQSLNIAKEYEKKDDRIKVYSDGLNKNLGYRLNQIPSLVSTKYLARMDADDIMHPLRLQKQIEALEKHPEIDVLGTNAYSIDENNNVVGIRLDTNCGYLVDVHHFIHPTIMAKTEWFKNNPYDVKAIRLEDAELWFRTKNMNTFKMLSEPLFFYREFSGSYFKKYWKGYKTVFYLNKKYKFSKPFVGWIFTTPITILIYFLFEQVLKSDKLNLRRNEIVFKSRKIVKI
ncbi:glycosyltransferase family 2 protein [Empedobacter sp. ULE_I140]